jgi:hypothetical protein
MRREFDVTRLPQKRAANPVRKWYAGKRRGEDRMKQSIDQDQLKDLIKTVLVEVLEQRRDLLHDAVEEALEDVALARAIEEGEGTELIERQEVFNLLDGKA